MADESLCLDAPTANTDPEASVRFQACTEMKRQMWKYEAIKKALIHIESGKCLSHPNAGTSDVLILRDCSSSKEQIWTFHPKKWRQ